MSPRFLSFARLLGLSALLMGLSIGCGGSSPGGNPPPVETPRPDAERSTVEVSRAQGVVANGQDASELTVTVRRASGEAMGGQQVRLELSGEGAKATPAEGTTDASGVWRTALTATQPGAKTVKVSVLAAGGAVVLATRPTVTFGASAATKLAFVTVPQSAPAGVPLAPVLEVAIQDAQGHGVAGATNEVTLALGTHPDGAVLEGNVTARAVNGVARFPELVLKKAGTGYTLVASAEGLASATSAAFEVAPIEVASLTLQLSAQSVTAGEPVDLTVTLGDGLGNLKTNYVGTVRLSSPDATAVLPAAEYTFTAEDAGQHTFQGFVFKRAGTAHITVTEKELGVLLEATADVSVLPGPAAKLAFTAQPASQSVNQALGTVQVSLADAFDNKVAVNAPDVTVALLGGSGVSLGGVKTVAPADGVASFTNLSVDTEGTGYTLAASAEGLTGATSAAFDILDDVAPAKPVLAAGTVTKDSIAVEWNAVGDDGLQGTATAYELRYATSNIVTDADFAAATRATTGAPQAPGTREGVSLTGLSAGTTYYVALQVTDSAGNAVRSDTLQVSTLAARVAALVFTQQPANGVAGVELADITVSLVDEGGNVVTSADSAVTLTLSADAAVTVTRNASAGVATFSGVVIQRAGTGYTFQATSGGLPTATSNPFSISAASVAKLSVARASQSGAATAGVAEDFTVTALDAFDNVAKGYTGTVVFTSTDTKAHLPASGAFSAADEGQKTFSVTFESVGSQQVSLSDAANALTASVGYTVSAGPAAGFALTAPTTVGAGATFEARVTAMDAYGNVATGYQGTVRLSSTDAAVPAAEHTFAAEEQGVHAFSVALKTAGARELTAQDTVDAALVATHALTVNPGAATKLVLAGGAGPMDAGTSFALEVVARDAFDNVATGYLGTVHFTSSDNAASLPADSVFTADDNGRRTVTGFVLNTGGEQTILAVDTAVASVTGTFAVQVTANVAEATRFVLNTPAGPYTAGQTVSIEVVAYADAFNVATAYTGTVRFTSTDASAVLPADYTFTAANEGRHSFDVEFKTAGTVTLTVTDTASPALTKSFSEQVQAGAPAELAFSSEPANGTVRAALGTVKVALVDAYGNATTATAPDVTLALKGGSASATLGGTKTATPAAGEATFSNLSVDAEGTGYQLTATAGGFAAQDSATFDIVDDVAPNAPTLGTSAANTSVTLTWTAVGDDANEGVAAAYELRYATSAITNDAEFSAATPIPTSAPNVAGSVETYTVAGLTPQTTYHFALKVLDGANNASALASASATTLSPCDGVTCTPQPASCTAGNRGVVTHASACVVSGETGTCQETTSAVACSAQQVCANGACVAASEAPQAGGVIVSEFRALGSEFIELRNTTAADVDVRGFILENKAWQRVTLRAATDPSDAASTPVVVPAGGVLHGVANPAGAVPAGVGFVYGEPGTDFALDDTGDLLVLSDASGSVEDVVDFRTFVTSPNTALTATTFVGFAGSSTQLDPTKLTATANDAATSWCVSFYPAGAKPHAKVADTAGAANGSCQVAVINEVLIDVTGVEDGKSFLEIAGPGGALVGGVRITDIEGKGASAGALNTDGDRMAGETDGIIVLPEGTRLPADGLLIVADGLADGTTTVPNVVPGVDVIARDVDFENSTNSDPAVNGDSIQLISADGTTLLDALGTEPSGAPLSRDVATANALAMYETGTALYPPLNASLARNTASTDGDNNRTDFRADPSPTPGLPNDTVAMTVTGLSPNNTLTTATTTTGNVVITGTDFATGVTVRFGTVTVNCTATNSTTLTCGSVPANSTVGPVDVTVANPASVPGSPVVVAGGFTYTGVLNGTSNPAQADYCVLQWPPTLTVTQGQATDIIYGQLYEGGVTDANAGPVPGLKAEVGYGPLNSNPTTATTWRYFPTTFNVKTGNNFEFQGTLTAPSVATTTHFSYAYRFSFDDGLNWTYCDLDGAGGNSGLSFSAAQLGDMTVNP